MDIKPFKEHTLILFFSALAAALICFFYFGAEATKEIFLFIVVFIVAVVYLIKYLFSKKNKK